MEESSLWAFKNLNETCQIVKADIDSWLKNTDFSLFLYVLLKLCVRISRRPLMDNSLLEHFVQAKLLIHCKV